MVFVSAHVRLYLKNWSDLKINFTKMSTMVTSTKYSWTNTFRRAPGGSLRSGPETSKGLPDHLVTGPFEI